MTCIRGGAFDYCDGTYVGFCASQKEQMEFDGTVSMTDTGRIVASGRCSCREPVTVTLYTPDFTG